MIGFTNSRGQSINIDKSPFKLIDFDPGRATMNFQTGKSANQMGKSILIITLNRENSKWNY
ncbi:hypothetical protein P7H17_25470 [Paenibacillus larvae]|nr:hypothetical protein [Paenibacillus larvae]MDT2288727.1 hypothetical protein [Paenibacillus larvae]